MIFNFFGVIRLLVEGLWSMINLYIGGKVWEQPFLLIFHVVLIQLNFHLMLFRRLGFRAESLGWVVLTLVFSIYGVTGMTPNSRKANDYLLATIFEVAAVAKLPVVIGGDFNIRPTNLPSFELFRQQGFVEAFDLYEMKHGFQLPPTCNGKTRNDTFILHPKLIPFVKDMRVVTG